MTNVFVLFLIEKVIRIYFTEFLSIVQHLFISSDKNLGRVMRVYTVLHCHLEMHWFNGR